MAPTRASKKKRSKSSAPAPPPVAVVKIEKKRAPPAPEPNPPGGKKAKYEAKTAKTTKKPAPVKNGRKVAGLSASKKKAATVVDSTKSTIPPKNSPFGATNEVKISRHCAFCLIPLAEKDVKKCGKCLRRAYCSRECQRKDWTSKKSLGEEVLGKLSQEEGQGHKDWCGLPVCEEDLDWVVKEGGQGVVAKRLILKGERIFVGNMKNSGNPATVTAPALFKHSCDANSAAYHGMDFKVAIVSAEKDIQPGTEITKNYIGFNDHFMATSIIHNGQRVGIKSFEDSRRVLGSLYGIICPLDCFCYDKEIEQILVKGKEFNENVCKFVEAGSKLGPEVLLGVAWAANFNAIENAQNEISDFDKVRGRRVMKALWISALLTPMDQERWKYANLIPNYEKEAKDIFKAVFHPDSAFSGVEGLKILKQARSGAGAFENSINLI